MIDVEKTQVNKYVHAMVPYIENNDEVLPKEVPWGVYYDEDVHENLYEYFFFRN